MSFFSQFFSAPSPPAQKTPEKKKKERTPEEEAEDLKKLEEGLPQSFQQDIWAKEEKLTQKQREERSKGIVIKVNSIPLWKNDKRNVKTKSALYPHNPDLETKVALYRGDITKLAIGAVVNAANRSLLGGGGIDGCIHSAAGSRLKEECREHNGCETGQSKITRAYSMPSQYVIHTVGPIGEKPELLTSCYNTVLNLAAAYKVKSVALCGVSTGIYGYPLQAASKIALKTVREWLEANPDKLDLVLFCTFLANEEACYTELFPQYFPAEGSELVADHPTPSESDSKKSEDVTAENSDGKQEQTSEENSKEKYDSSEAAEEVEKIGESLNALKVDDEKDASTTESEAAKEPEIPQESGNTEQ